MSDNSYLVRYGALSQSQDPFGPSAQGSCISLVPRSALSLRGRSRRDSLAWASRCCWQLSQCRSSADWQRAACMANMTSGYRTRFLKDGPASIAILDSPYAAIIFTEACGTLRPSSSWAISILRPMSRPTCMSLAWSPTSSATRRSAIQWPPTQNWRVFSSCTQDLQNMSKMGSSTSGRHYPGAASMNSMGKSLKPTMCYQLIWDTGLMVQLMYLL